MLSWAKKIVLLLVVPGLVACSADSRQARLTTLTGSTMGTTYSVKITDLPPGCNPDSLQAGIERILTVIDAQMSTYNPDSEVSRFNASRSTDWMAISTDTLLVIDEALRIARLTKGAFDVTVDPLVRLWGFGAAVPQQLPPAQEQIRAIMDNVNYTHIQTQQSPPAVRKKHVDISIDLSAIAKGFGVDKIAEYLSAADLDNYLVEIGGELRGRGCNPQGLPWQIAIEQPLAGQRSIQQVIRLADWAIATSGHYRNFFEQDKRRYSHLIDPVTGRPVIHPLASVSVLSPSSMFADGMATALMVLGPDAGVALAKRENLAAFFIVKTENGFVEISTPAFDQYLIR
jgi:thiamine biosynthesis lipoprotein